MLYNKSMYTAKESLMDQDLAYQEYDAFVKQLEETYPAMFSGPYGGIAVEAGWWPIIVSLCAGIQHHLDWKNRQSPVVPQVIVAQIKEKFGGLRFYYDGGDDYIRGLVSMAEAWAAKSCEECGAPGTSRDGSWIKTLCNTHHNLRESRKQSGV